MRSGDFIVPGSTQNRVDFTIPEGLSGLTSGSLQVLSQAAGATASPLRTIALDAAQLSSGAHALRWNGLDDHGRPLTEAASPYTVRIVVRQGNETRQGERRNRRIEEWTLSITIGDAPPKDDPDALVSGIDEETITPENFEVTVGFEGEKTLVRVPSYDIEPNVESPDGPPDNAWDALVRFMRGPKSNFIFYTTPSGPYQIRYCLTMLEKGDYVRDGVGNMWDMDDRAVNVFENKGTWMFGVMPRTFEKQELLMHDFEERYEEAEEDGTPMEPLNQGPQIPTP